MSCSEHVAERNLGRQEGVKVVEEQRTGVAVVAGASIDSERVRKETGSELLVNRRNERQPSKKRGRTVSCVSGRINKQSANREEGWYRWGYATGNHRRAPSNCIVLLSFGSL